MNVLLLSGGLSAEREVSFRSAQSVKDALIKNKHVIIDYDPADGLDGLKRYVGRVDVCFPVLHGKYGEDGEVQKVLEDLKLPYVGATSAISRLCFDKYMFSAEVSRLGYLIPQSELVTQDQFLSSYLAQKPYVLKPNDGGSSIDTLIATDHLLAKDDAINLFKKYPELLLQELIIGTEITVAVLGDEALPVVEIIPPQGEEFDYENKYNGRTAENCPPLTVSEELQTSAQRIALDIHQKLGVRHLSRTDMIITESGDIYVLELNTIPGLTENSLMPKAAKAAGITMEQIVERLIRMAL